MTNEIIRIEHLTKYYGPKLILNNISLSINRDERMALIGENGTGKTTLCRILLGQESTEAGNVKIPQNTRVGYLPQEVIFNLSTNTTVQEYIEEASGQLNKLQAQMQQLETQMATNLPEQEMDSLLQTYGTMQEQFHQLGGYELDYKMEQVFAGLEIDYIPKQRTVHSLSGGEKTRVALASLLLQEPDVLILDEPTNHLDADALAWLEDYLNHYPNALLMVSHDRRFINRIATKILELSPTTHEITIYHGNYEDYVAEREHQYQMQLTMYQERVAEMKRLHQLIKAKTHSRGKGKAPTDGDKFIKIAKQQQSDRTASKEIQDARKRLERLEDTPLSRPGLLWNVRFDLKAETQPSAEVVRFEALTKHFDQQVLFEKINLVLRGGERVILVGANGSGKTTLLKLVMRQLQPDEGAIYLSHSTTIGYLDQEQETLSPERTVFDVYKEIATGTDKNILTALHRTGLFSGDITSATTVGSLSIGQRRKLQLATIVATKANLLILDEPSNHLDLASLEALEQGLLGYNGTVLATSHDRWFIDKIATEIWHFDNHTIWIERIAS